MAQITFKQEPVTLYGSQVKKENMLQILLS